MSSELSVLEFRTREKWLLRAFLLKLKKGKRMKHRAKSWLKASYISCRCLKFDELDHLGMRVIQELRSEKTWNAGIPSIQNNGSACLRKYKIIEIEVRYLSKSDWTYFFLIAVSSKGVEDTEDPAPERKLELFSLIDELGSLRLLARKSAAAFSPGFLSS